MLQKSLDNSVKILHILQQSVPTSIVIHCELQYDFWKQQQQKQPEQLVHVLLIPLKAISYMLQNERLFHRTQMYILPLHFFVPILMFTWN